MGREEQKEEREVLDSIFPDEIQDISDTEYRVTVTLDVKKDEEDDADPIIILNVRYPEGYPDEAPMLDPNGELPSGIEVQPDAVPVSTASVSATEPVPATNAPQTLQQEIKQDILDATHPQKTAAPKS